MSKSNTRRSNLCIKLINNLNPIDARILICNIADELSRLPPSGKDDFELYSSICEAAFWLAQDGTLALQLLILYLRYGSGKDVTKLHKSWLKYKNDHNIGSIDMKVFNTNIEVAQNELDPQII